MLSNSLKCNDGVDNVLAKYTPLLFLTLDNVWLNFKEYFGKSLVDVANWWTYAFFVGDNVLQLWVIIISKMTVINFFIFFYNKYYFIEKKIWWFELFAVDLHQQNNQPL